MFKVQNWKTDTLLSQQISGKMRMHYIKILPEIEL